MEIIRIKTAASTNDIVNGMAKSDSRDLFIYADEQTAGRGQRGNSWEAEPGKNLTASALIHPSGLEAREQFLISEAVSLSVKELLLHFGIDSKVKWPNDIYVDDCKISGILIEHSLLGREICHSVAGVGINVNQQHFVSDAPNPVSMWQITENVYDISDVAERFAVILENRIKTISSESGKIATHAEFLNSLWRGDGEFYLFADKLKGEHFMAKISGVAPDGILTLEKSDNEKRNFAFKEVEFILTE